MSATAKTNRRRRSAEVRNGGVPHVVASRSTARALQAEAAEAHGWARRVRGQALSLRSSTEKAKEAISQYFYDQHLKVCKHTNRVGVWEMNTAGAEQKLTCVRCGACFASASQGTEGAGASRSQGGVKINHSSSLGGEVEQCRTSYAARQARFF